MCRIPVMAKKSDILEHAPYDWANRILADSPALEAIQYCRDEANMRRQHGLDLLEGFWLAVEKQVIAKVNGAHW